MNLLYMNVFFVQGTIIEHKKKYKPGTEADVIDMFLHEMKNHGESSPIFTGAIKFISYFIYIRKHIHIF